MANILVVQDHGQLAIELKQCLAPPDTNMHQVIITSNINSAKILLDTASFDLVICGAHLRNGTVFELLNFVKDDPKKRLIPFVCFCCIQSELARTLNDSVRNTAMLLGADKYITQERFDAELFRDEIDSLIPALSSGKI